MTILGVIAALMLVFAAYIVGEKRGDATGYERGAFDGRQSARNEAVITAADVARRLRETAERERAAPAPPLREGAIKSNVNHAPSGARPAAPKSQTAPRRR